MRGKGPQIVRCTLDFRITPAYAGKSWLAHDCRRKIRDHPRLCGEKNAPVPARVPEMGSPPPMRGKGSSHSFKKSSIGITPAYAGKSYRMSGYIGVLVGSPPPMRGKGFAGLPIRSRAGITPAYAGKRSYGGWLKEVRQDHPRLCGEKSMDERAEIVETGSPPPMRGKVLHGSMDERAERITPAYAGKSV